VRTERLELEQLTPEHAEEMVAVLADPCLYRFTGGAPPGLGELRARYERQARGRSADGASRWLNWIVREQATGEAVGYVQATVDVASRVADLAWVIGARHQRRGYAREAAGALVGALRDDGVLALTAHVRPGHAASEGVARAIGLLPTGHMRGGEMRWANP
jgi:RimJ/RimL family protein N-acetyltransferase